MPTTDVQSSVCLAICTCNRPALLRILLESLCLTDLSHAAAIVVIDNHESRSGISLVTEFLAEKNFSAPVFVFHEGQPGIANARNRAVQEANLIGSGYIAFIDDDEEPSPAWLNELIAVRNEFEAEVVGGPVLPIFEGVTTPWHIESGFFEQRQPAGANAPAINSTANVLIKLSSLGKFGIEPFDRRFGLTGGSDQVLFTRLANSGASMAWAQKAVVFERQGSSRLNDQWIANRAFRNGNINMRAELLFAADRGRSRIRLTLTSLTRASIALLFGLALSLLNMLRGSNDLGGTVMRNKALGRMAALRGNIFEEYADRHQRSSENTHANHSSF